MSDRRGPAKLRESTKMHKAFASARNKNADFWIHSAIQLATVLLKDRRMMKSRLEPAEFKVYERVSYELLSRTIWKYSEAYGKYQGNQFWSENALDHFSAEGPENLLRHEHVFPQRQLIKLLREIGDPDHAQVKQLFEKYAVGVVLKKDEDGLLREAKRVSALVQGGLANPWLRYDLGDHRIIIAEHRGLPIWHARKLRKARLFR